MSPSDSTLGNIHTRERIPKEIKNSTQRPYTDVHSRIIHNSKKKKSQQPNYPSIDEKEPVTKAIYHMIPFV